MLDIGRRDPFSPLLEPKGVRPFMRRLGSPEGFRGSGGGGGEGEGKLGSAGGGVGGADGAAVLFGDLADDREAEAGAGAAAGGGAAVEAVEEVGEVLGVDARA